MVFVSAAVETPRVFVLWQTSMGRRISPSDVSLLSTMSRACENSFAKICPIGGDCGATNTKCDRFSDFRTQFPALAPRRPRSSFSPRHRSVASTSDPVGGKALFYESVLDKNWKSPIGNYAPSQRRRLARGWHSFFATSWVGCIGFSVDPGRSRRAEAPWRKSVLPKQRLGVSLFSYRGPVRSCFIQWIWRLTQIHNRVPAQLQGGRSSLPGGRGGNRTFLNDSRFCTNPEWAFSRFRFPFDSRIEGLFSAGHTRTEAMGGTLFVSLWPFGRVEISVTTSSRSPARRQCDFVRL